MDQIDKLKLLKDSKIPHASIYINMECASCHIVEKEMVKLGSIYLCQKCFTEKFNTEDPINLEREQYLKFVKDKI